MKDLLNSRIKHREHFRPFCPSVLAECRFGLLRNRLSVALHGHRVSHQEAIACGISLPSRTPMAPAAFKPSTGNPTRSTGNSSAASATSPASPFLLNTSFNENEPIVQTPAQALDCFLRTRMDVLAMGSYILLKSENNLHARRKASVL
jgi:carbamoyltransferase